jgi:hypothetical protein
VVWGSPATLAVTFVARLAIGNGAPFVAIFWASLAAVVIGAVLGAKRGNDAELQALPAE